MNLNATNVFTSRSPCNAEEISTCIEMLEDSPFWDDAAYNQYLPTTLNHDEIVRAWETILSDDRIGDKNKSGTRKVDFDKQGGCRGYIDIIENESYNRILRKTPPRTQRNQSYKHQFHSVWFVAYLAEWFLKEIIANPSIPDISFHFIRRMVEHFQNPSAPSPVPTTEDILKAHHQAEGYRLYIFSFCVWHPAISLFDERVMRDSTAYIKRIWVSAERFHAGFSHHAWINNVYGEIIMNGYLGAGHKLFRPYPDNDERPSDKKKYFLCLTKDMAVSDVLGVPKNKDITYGIGNNFSQYFGLNREVIARLTPRQQQTAYLISVGYSPEQIAKVMKLSTGDINGYQHAVCKRLYKNGYASYFPKPAYEGDEPLYSREDLKNVILDDNMHEVRRSVIVPLYPWPEGLYLRK